ncbi:MAG: IS1 family transposase [Pyrinomonadaceae bacterium]
MANVLNTDKQIAITAALAEGNSIRSIERMTGVHRDTIMRLGVRIGQGCAKVLDQKMRGLKSKRIQLDEIWGFVGKKDKNLKYTDDPDRLGSVWTFCAVDADSKIVPCFRVGKRDSYTANAFLDDLAGRLVNRVHISTDALPAYYDAVEQAFGADVDYSQIVKSFGTDKDGKYTPERKYSPPQVVSLVKYPMSGKPNMLHATTSHVERLNASTRLHVKRLNRLTLAFSKRIENFEAAVALHFAAYNFVRPHRTLKMTPAIKAGIEKKFWSYTDLFEAATS